MPKMLVFTEQFALPHVQQAIDTVVRQADPRQNEPMKKMVLRLIDLVRRLA